MRPEGLEFGSVNLFGEDLMFTCVLFVRLTVKRIMLEVTLKINEIIKVVSSFKRLF